MILPVSLQSDICIFVLLSWFRGQGGLETAEGLGGQGCPAFLVQGSGSGRVLLSWFRGQGCPAFLVRVVSEGPVRGGSACRANVGTPLISTIFVYLSIYLSIHISIYLSIYLSIDLFTFAHDPGSEARYCRQEKSRRQSIYCLALPGISGIRRSQQENVIVQTKLSSQIIGFQKNNQQETYIYIYIHICIDPKHIDNWASPSHGGPGHGSRVCIYIYIYIYIRCVYIHIKS